MSDEELLKWIWLSAAAYTAPAAANTLLKYFGGAQGVWEADEEKLSEVNIKYPSLTARLADKDLKRAGAILGYCRANGVGIVTPEDFFYPEGLRRLKNRPVALYHLGGFIDFEQEPCVAVVGTRHPSDYAVRCAKTVSLDLANAGAVIVSGLAAGVDACAHKAALYAGKFTVGVLGCGIDVVYPKENAELYAEVARNGLIVTEFPPSTPPVGSNFPMRNRIISGLSDAVVAVEGSERSGALITAEYALRQDKFLFTVPGSVFYSGCSGTNALLKLGARPCLEAADVTEVLAEKYPSLKADRKRAPAPGKDGEENKKGKKKKLFSSGKDLPQSEAAIPPAFEAPEKPEPKEPGPEAPEAPSITLLNAEQLALYTRLGSDPVTPDQLAAGGDVRKVLKTLTALELKGFVKRVPGGRFAAISER